MAEPENSSELTRAERIFVRISVVQTILAVTGFLVGVIALFAALNEADAVRKQQMASVWPHVVIRDINYGIAGEERFKVVVGNRGIGPARIMSATVLIDDEPIDSWADIVRPLAEDGNFRFSNVRVSGSVLSPAEDIIAFAVDAKYTSKQLVDAVQELTQSRRVNVVICYCSVFDDCFMLDGLAEATVPVDACAALERRSSI
ncbi:MAG: hypothetical protein AAFX08_07355 [Pseudomonadota bacterium]